VLLILGAAQIDVGAIRLMMEKLVTGYTPNDEIVDWVYLEQEAEALAMDAATS
jgi:hypothetical protein